jgi:hypothetical protein
MEETIPGVQAVERSRAVPHTTNEGFIFNEADFSRDIGVTKMKIRTGESITEPRRRRDTTPAMQSKECEILKDLMKEWDGLRIDVLERRKTDSLKSCGPKRWKQRSRQQLLPDDRSAALVRCQENAYSSVDTCNNS